MGDDFEECKERNDALIRYHFGGFGGRMYNLSDLRYQGYLLNLLRGALEAEEKGVIDTEYPPIPELIDACHTSDVPDAEIRHMLIGSKYEIKKEEPEFDFAEMKESLDSVVGDVTELKKTVKGFEDKFVTKDNFKRELIDMEGRMTEKITERVSEKVGEITTRQIREELQRLRKEYAEIPPEMVPLEEIVEEEVEEVTRAYHRELRTVETWVRSVVELKNYLNKYKTAPPFDMNESERLKMIEIIVDKLIVLIPETEEGISNIEKVQSDLTNFNIPEILKKKLIELLDGAELVRYALVI